MQLLQSPKGPDIAEPDEPTENPVGIITLKDSTRELVYLTNPFIDQFTELKLGDRVYVIGVCNTYRSRIGPRITGILIC